MFGAIKYNLSNLLNFSGRDARQTFWFFVLFIFLIQFGVSMLASLPMYADMMTTVMGQMGSDAAPESVNAAMFTAIASHMKTQMAVGTASGVIGGLLLAAAFVRRLHDSGRPGWIALIAFAAYFVGLFMSWSAFDEMMVMMEEMMTAEDQSARLTAQSQLYMNGALTWLAYLIVIGFGVLKSTDGPNEYGEAPVRF